MTLVVDPKPARSLPPLGAVALGGFAAGAGLMAAYFAWLGLGGRFLGLGFRGLPWHEIALTALAGALAVVTVPVGLGVAFGARSWARWLAWLEVAVASVTAAHGLVIGEPALALGLGGVHALAAVLLFLVARAHRHGPAPVRVWRLAVLGLEVLVAGVFLAGGVSLWFDEFEGDDPPGIGTAIAEVGVVPREPLTVLLPSLDGAARPAWSEGPRVTLVNYWATWCVPCVKELPDLALVAAAHDPSEVAVVLVEVHERDADRVRRLLAERAPGLTCLQDPSQETWSPVAVALGRDAIPTTILVDADGRPVSRWQGRRSVEEMEHEIGLVLAGLR